MAFISITINYNILCYFTIIYLYFFMLKKFYFVLLCSNSRIIVYNLIKLKYKNICDLKTELMENNMNCVIVKNIELGCGKPKICTSVVGKSETEIIKECEKISSMNVDIVELRCDFYEYIKDITKVCNLLDKIKKILNNKPLIFTIRSKEEGGEINISENEYMDLYKNICKKKLTDIIDVELRVGDEKAKQLVEIAHNNDIKVIISKHDFEKTPSKNEMIEDLIRMQKLKGDIPKLAVMPNDYIDVIKLLEVTNIMKEKYNETPIITISMGTKGIISRMSGQIFGSCLTFASGSKASAPGQIGVEDLDISLEIINKYYKEEINLQKNNIILVGFMGTGKSSVSKKLSEVLKMKSIDTDQYIERKENATIDEIFSINGEEYFRKCEKDTLLELSKKENTIISCGGGIVIKEDNIKLMKTMGKVILLTASSNTIYKRVKSCKDRPILNNNMNKEYISTLMKKREERYLQAADIIINTDNKSIEKICEEIINKL